MYTFKIMSAFDLYVVQITSRAKKAGEKEMGKGNQRADVKNQNNPAYKADRNNTSNQRNPNNRSYTKSRGK